MDNNTLNLPAPKPALGIERYKAELTKRLLQYPRCASNYARYLKSKRRGIIVDYLPIKLDIENVSRCNFACAMCQVSEWPKGRRASDMSLEHFKEIIDEQYGLVEIKIQGLGEPTTLSSVA